MQIGLKTGYTTGACAAAAAKAATLALSTSPVNSVKIRSPSGKEIEIPIKTCEVIAPGTARASVVKDAGDDEKYDITHGIDILATVTFHRGTGIVVKCGEGVGMVTKPGLPVKVGEPAINPVPKRMIIESVREALPPNISAEIVISVPDGAKVANRTYNPKLGITGGISILGTTGIVIPRSRSAYIASLVSQVDVAVAQGHKRLVLVPGNIGESIAKQLLETPADTIIETGDFMGYMIKKAVEKGVKEILILGHPGKLVKLAAGIFNTNYRMGDGRKEVVAAYAAMAGAPKDVIETIMKANTTDEMVQTLENLKLSDVTFNLIANAVKDRVTEKINGEAKVSVAMVSLDGRILGLDSNARGLDFWRRSS
jgi:cobalt-precorrin-5B (C1)-methyltransferase